MDRRVQWNDIMNGSSSELKKTYKISDRQLEMAVKNHTKGASHQERLDVYNHVWRRGQ